MYLGTKMSASVTAAMDESVRNLCAKGYPIQGGKATLQKYEGGGRARKIHPVTSDPGPVTRATMFVSSDFRQPPSVKNGRRACGGTRMRLRFRFQPTIQ